MQITEARSGLWLSFPCLTQKCYCEHNRHVSRQSAKSVEMQSFQADNGTMIKCLPATRCCKLFPCDPSIPITFRGGCCHDLRFTDEESDLELTDLPRLKCTSLESKRSPPGYSELGHNMCYSCRQDFASSFSNNIPHLSHLLRGFQPA